MNIPIFRAKKIDSDDYVEGYYKPEDSVSQLFVNRKEGNYIMTLVSDYDYRDCEINPTTLAIHFPDMLDSQGNKIFASLSKDGKGGDCTFMENGYNETFCWDRLNACVVLKSRNYECRCFRNGSRNETTFNKYKIIGIQE